MSNLGDPLATNNNIQGRSRTFLEIWGAVVNALVNAADIGPGITVIDAIIGILDPPPGSSQPSLQDLLNKLNEFTTFVANALAQIDKTIAGGQIQTWANELQNLLAGPEGPLSVIPEIDAWKTNPGLIRSAHPFRVRLDGNL